MMNMRTVPRRVAQAILMEMTLRIKNGYKKE
jgi:hypothetical protein